MKTLLMIRDGLILALVAFVGAIAYVIIVEIAYRSGLTSPALLGALAIIFATGWLAQRVPLLKYARAITHELRDSIAHHHWPQMH